MFGTHIYRCPSCAISIESRGRSRALGDQPICPRCGLESPILHWVQPPGSIMRDQDGTGRDSATKNAKLLLDHHRSNLSIKNLFGVDIEPTRFGGYSPERPF